MPVVDVRNIPTVVEFAPDNKVVEFNEELVTAEVAVGPTVVEFSWGELVPGPGLRGGGVFEGTVHIDQDIPSLPNNSEPIDPEADYLMLYDASSNLHVKVLAQLGAGGIAEIPWATREETDAGVLTDKALNPDVGAYAYDRFRHVGQHAAGKGTATVNLSPVSGVVTVNGALSNVFYLTLNDNITQMANPINPVNGQTINIHLKQPVAGGKVIQAWGDQWTFTNKINPVLSTAGNAHDMLSCQWNEVDGKMHCSFLPNYGANYTPPPETPFENFNFINLGGGNEVFKDIVVTDINLRTIVGGGDINVSTADDTIVVSYTAPAALDLSNVPFFFSGSVDDYPAFLGAKALLPGVNISFDTSVAGQVSINALAVGVPEGGTLGQVLTKFGAGDHDMGWADSTGGAGGGGGSVPEHPDIPPTTPDVIDDEFEYGTGLDTSGARRSGSPSPAAWTLAAGASSSEWTVAQGALQVVGTSGGWAFVPIPDTNWKVRAKCHLHRQSTWSFLTNMGAGLSLRDTIADRRMSFMQGYFGQPKFDVAVWNTWTYVSTPASVSSYSANDHYQMRLPVYLELERSGTTIYFRFSRSGFDQTFFTIWSGSIGTYFANNPDEVGLYVQTASQTLAAIYEWFRRIS